MKGGGGGGGGDWVGVVIWKHKILLTERFQKN